MGLRDNLRRIIQDDSVPLETVMSILMLDSVSLRLPSDEVLTTKSRYGPADEGALKTQDHRRALKLVVCMGDQLVQSSWAQVDLAHEDGVCDFIADLLCSDPSFVAELEILGLWLKRKASEGTADTDNDVATHQATTSRSRVGLYVSLRDREGRLEQLGLNLRSALTIKLPKRSGGSMIHVAAGGAGYVVLSGVIRILKLILPSDKWKQILDSRCRPFGFGLAFPLALCIGNPLRASLPFRHFKSLSFSAPT